MALDVSHGKFRRGLDYHPVPPTTHPAAALDSLRLTIALRKLTQKEVFLSLSRIKVFLVRITLLGTATINIGLRG